MSFRVGRDENGATLILVIGFMVMVGLVIAGLSGQLSSSLASRVGFDLARNREYAADGAIETAITQVRTNMETGHANTPCPTTSLTQRPGLNGVNVQVDCTFIQGYTLSLSVRRDALFTACEWTSSTGPQCAPSAAIIQARVSFASIDPPTASTISVNGTYVQSWNVKG